MGQEIESKWPARNPGILVLLFLSLAQPAELQSRTYLQIGSVITHTHTQAQRQPHFIFHLPSESVSQCLCFLFFLLCFYFLFFDHLHGYTVLCGGDPEQLCLWWYGGVGWGGGGVGVGGGGITHVLRTSTCLLCVFCVLVRAPHCLFVLYVIAFATRSKKLNHHHKRGWLLLIHL